LNSISSNIKINFMKNRSNLKSNDRLLKRALKVTIKDFRSPEAEPLVGSRGKAPGGCSRLLQGLRDIVPYIFRVQGRSPWWVQQTAARGKGQSPGAPNPPTYSSVEFLVYDSFQLDIAINLLILQITHLFLEIRDLQMQLFRKDDSKICLEIIDYDF
jgi:hypothetical protein